MTSPRRVLLLGLLVAAGAVLVWSVGPRRASDSGAEPRAIRATRDGVEFPATVNRSGFERELLGMPGYHLIVWNGGRAASAALFRAAVTDVEVLEALESLGAVPGDNLGMDTWEERENPASAAPTQVIAGPPIEVLVRIPGRAEPLALGDLLDDPGGRGFSMRFGGHRANIPAWRSGCVACLYSCPGSKVGNAAYTVRDFVDGVSSFRVKDGTLPEDGSEVTIVLRLTGAPEEGSGYSRP